jgi:hypothetical protein
MNQQPFQEYLEAILMRRLLLQNLARDTPCPKLEQPHVKPLKLECVFQNYDRLLLTKVQFHMQKIIVQSI